MAEHSYLGAAFAAGPNRTAAGATLAIALAVFGLSQIPIASGSELDLRNADAVDGWTQGTVFGFGVPTPAGRAVAQVPGRIVWNRPLPSEFTLALDVAPGPPNRSVRVGLGLKSEVIALPRSGPLLVRLENPFGLRELRIAPVPPGSPLMLRRVGVQ